MTVFMMEKSSEHPNGVIVKRGLSFVDKKGTPVEDSLSTQRTPDESGMLPKVVLKL